MVDKQENCPQRNQAKLQEYILPEGKREKKIEKPNITHS